MHGNLRKTVIGSAVSAVLLAGLLSVPVLAAEDAEKYDVWVGGVRITSENKDNVFANDAVNDKKVKYDPDSNTLTFDGAEICGISRNGLVYSETEDLIITGKAEFTNDFSYANAISSATSITFYSADITIQNADTGILARKDISIYDSKIDMEDIGDTGISTQAYLTVSGAKTDINIESVKEGILGFNTKITDGAKVSVSANATGLSGKDLEIKDSSFTVKDSSTGISADTLLIDGKNSVVDIKAAVNGIDGNIVTISAGKTTIDATLEFKDKLSLGAYPRSGISANQTLTIAYPDTYVEVKGKEVGLSAPRYLKIENSKVKVFGKEIAIASNESVYILGKKAEIVADSKEASAIYCTFGTITISNELEIKLPENGYVDKDNGPQRIVESDGTTNASHVVITSHKLTYVPATEPTLDKDGNKEHYKCDDCDDIFADPAGETRLDKDSVIIPKLQPTPTPTTAPTATPTSSPSATPTSVAVPTAAAPTATTAPATPTPTTAPADSKAQIMDFVKRIYIYVLDREPEEEGAAYWSEELWAFRRTGAEVAQGFIFSDEFVNRNTSDQEFVTILYKTFFGRDPEEDGMNFWLTQLSTGIMDRVTVANGFIYSQEWADTCASYGIRSGGDLKPNGTIEPTELTYAFVERMYTTAMGRGYDEEGRQYWAGELANFNITGEQVGASFFLSEEMNGYNLSDAEFLGRLYQTFMNREADEGGAAYWLGIMASGTPRADIVYGFTRSPEFTEKCVEARILPY